MSEFIRVTVEHLVDGAVHSSRVQCFNAEVDLERFGYAFDHKSVLDQRVTEIETKVMVSSRRSF